MHARPIAATPLRTSIGPTMARLPGTSGAGPRSIDPALGPAISIRRAVALLGRFPALAGADLHVERGEIVHLCGPNGAGKTTLLRVCAGLVPLAEGEGEVLGHDLGRDRRSLRR